MSGNQHATLFEFPHRKLFLRILWIFGQLPKFYFFDISFDFLSSMGHPRKFSNEILFLISTSWIHFRIHLVENFLHFSRIAKIKYGSFWYIWKIWCWNRICGKLVFLSTWDYFLLIDVLFLRKHIFFHSFCSLSFPRLQ